MGCLKGFSGSQTIRKSQISGHLRIKSLRRMHPPAQKQHIGPVSMCLFLQLAVGEEAQADPDDREGRELHQIEGFVEHKDA